MVQETFDPIENDFEGDDTMVHTDRGCQYTSYAFKEMVERTGINHSMSRPGKCIDNGPIENFWGILKCESLYLDQPYDEEEFDKRVADFIEFYNTERVTLSMGLAIPTDEQIANYIKRANGE